MLNIEEQIMQALQDMAEIDVGQSAGFRFKQALVQALFERGWTTDDAEQLVAQMNVKLTVDMEQDFLQRMAQCFGQMFYNTRQAYLDAGWAEANAWNAVLTEARNATLELS